MVALMVWVGFGIWVEVVNVGSARSHIVAC